MKKNKSEKNEPYIIHYYFKGNNIIIVYSDNTFQSYPYSTKKEIELINTLKNQALELDKKIKQEKREKIFDFIQLTTCAALGGLSAIALVNGISTNSNYALNVAGLAVTSLMSVIFTIEFLKDSERIEETRKLKYYMQNQRAISKGLVSQNLEHCVSIDQANGIRQSDILACSMQELQNFAKLNLKKA